MDSYYEPPEVTVCAPGDHSWVAGMMVVHTEDVAGVAAVRSVECECCEKAYAPGDEYAD